MKKIASSIIILFYSGICMLGMRDRKGSCKKKERVCRRKHSSEEFLEKIYLHPSFVKSGTWTNMLFDVNQLTLSKDLPTKAKAVLEFIEKEKNVSFNVNVFFPEPLRHEAPFLITLIKKMHTRPAETLEPLVQKHLKKLPLILSAANYLDMPALLDASVNVAAKYLVTEKQLATFLSNPEGWPHRLNKDVGTEIVKKIIDTNPELLKGIPIPCIQTFKHNGYVWSVCFSPCGNFIASGSGDKNLKLWDVKKGTCIQTCSGHRVSVLSVCFSPCGNFIASGGWDKTIKLWDVKTGTCIQTFLEHSNTINSICFSPGGKFVASGSLDETVKLWDVKTGTCIQTFLEHSDFVNSVCFSPYGKFIATVSEDGTIKLWDVKTGRCIHTFSDHSWTVESVCFSPCGKFIASGSGDNTIKIWDVKTGRCIQTFSDHSWNVESVCFSPCGKFIASGSGDEKVKLWDVKTGKCIQTCSGHSRDVKSVCFSSCGKFIASGSCDGTIKLWGVKTGRCIQTFLDHNQKVISVCFSSCGDYIASGSRDKTIKLWDLTHLKNVYKLPLPHILFLLACKKLSKEGLPKPTFLNLEETYNQYFLQQMIKADSIL